MWQNYKKYPNRQTIRIFFSFIPSFPISPTQNANVSQQNYIHQQGIDDGGNGDNVVVEDERTTRHGDGLCGVLHSDFDDDGATLATRQSHQPRKQYATHHRRKNQDADRRAQRREFPNDGVLMGEEKHRRKRYQQRKSKEFEDFVDASSEFLFSHRQPDAEHDGNGHQNDVLHEQIADGQMDIGAGSDVLRDPRHDHRNGEQRNDATKRRERHREGDIAFRQHRENIARTAARTTCHEHDAKEKQRRKPENTAHRPRNDGQQDNLANQTSQNGFRTMEKEFEICRFQHQAEVEHQQRQNRKDNDNRVINDEFNQLNKNIVHSEVNLHESGAKLQKFSRKTKYLACFLRLQQ